MQRTIEGNHDMTQLSQTQPRNPALAIAGLAVAASLLGGIVGGIAGPRVQSYFEAVAAAQAAEVARAAAAHDQAVLAGAQEWEARQRQMYPITPTARDQAVLKQAQEWEARYRQMYPSSASTPYQDVLKQAQEWEARYRQMYPIVN